jgi:hypothetical protein
MHKEVGKSTLLGKKLTYVGFCFDNHPLEGAAKIQTVFYHLRGTDSYVLCMSEVAKPDLEQAIGSLGAVVDGIRIAPFAVRMAEGISFDELRELMEKVKPGVKFYWLSG